MVIILHVACERKKGGGADRRAGMGREGIMAIVRWSLGIAWAGYLHLYPSVPGKDKGTSFLRVASSASLAALAASSCSCCLP